MSKEKINGLAIIGIIIVNSCILYLCAAQVITLTAAYTHSGVGRCTILTKRIIYVPQAYMYSSNGGFVSPDTYIPDFTFTVQMADNRQLQARGYNIVPTGFTNRAEADAVMQRYQIGKVYSCWYNLSNPSQAWLSRTMPWENTFLIVVLVVLGCLAGSGSVFFLRRAIKHFWPQQLY